MSKPRLTLYESQFGDWVRIFVNGKQVGEGHSFDGWLLDATLEALGVEVVRCEVKNDEEGEGTYFSDLVPEGTLDG